MVVEDQIKQDLITYFNSKNIVDIEEGMKRLCDLLTDNIIAYENLYTASPAVQAWTSLQILQNSPFRYHKLQNGDAIICDSSVNLELLQMIPTKRFLFDILVKKVLNTNGCFGILGVRRTGKTILLQQLYLEHLGESIYLDCSFLQGNSIFSFKNFYTSALNSNKKIILLDEVCKIDDLYTDFISLTKLYASKLCIIITGSVKKLVENICDEICRGRTYELPPFMYVESLCWSNGINTPSYTNALPYISKDSFSTYLKNQFMPNNHLMSYMKGVVHDTIMSYRQSTYIEGNFDIDDMTLNNALKYISLCQLVYKRIDGNFIDPPNIEPDLREIIFNGDIASVRAKWRLKKSDIQLVISLLSFSGLIKTVYNISDFSENDHIEAFVFEYPWYVSYCFNPTIQDSDSLLDMWIEYALLLRVSYIYPNVAKYRSISGDEIDIVYKLDNWYGLEVKNRPKNNVSDRYTRHINRLAKQLDIKDIIISDEDMNATLIASLENEFINICLNDKFETDKTIRDLLSSNKLSSDSI